MFDAVSRSDGPARQRAIGSLRIGFKMRGAETVLDTLYQQGCLKARLPAVEAGAWRGAVTLNSSGGVAGGDRLDTAITLAAGTQATISAQAAERFYRALPGDGPAIVRTQASVGPGARLEWLPQETILFDRCALDRRLDVAMAEDAWFLGVEMLVFGRLAMGETVRTGSLRDLIRIRRDGRLIWHDAIRMDGKIDAMLHRQAVANGASALATIVHVGPDAMARLDAVRATGGGDAPVLADEDSRSMTEARVDTTTEIGASAWDGMLITRVLATTSAALRARVALVLHVLRDGRPLPRVWLC